MDAIQLTATILEGLDKGFECCRRPDPRPFSHWDNHCVNCGVHAGMAHRGYKGDVCPPQNYERVNDLKPSSSGLK